MDDDKKIQDPDFRDIFKNTGAQNWNELSQFVRLQGPAEWQITYSEAEEMAEDIDNLSRAGEPFTNDAFKVYNLVSRNQRNVGLKGGASAPIQIGNGDIQAAVRGSAWDKLFDGVF